MILRVLLRVVAPALLCVCCSAQTIRVGTLAPEGTYWHQVLQETAQEWRKISGGKIRVIVYPGGVQGTEREMLRKVGFNQLQAVALSGAGLPAVDTSLRGLTVPLLVQSWEEYDYILQRMRPQFEERVGRAGFQILQWSDAGFLRFFTKQPARTLADIKRRKFFTDAGDPATEELLQSFGFTPVPISVNELLPQLQTGLIEAFCLPPLFALANQSFGLARSMLDIKFFPLMAATVISNKAWTGLPEDLRPRLLEAARRLGEQSQARIRKLDDDAITEMKKRGLNVIVPDASLQAAWNREAEAAYPKLRGKWLPADIFDEVVRLRDEFRAGKR